MNKLLAALPGLLLATLLGSHAAVAAAPQPTVVQDSRSVGTITLLDSAGHAVSRGRTDVPLRSIASTAQGSGPSPAGFTDADELTMWVPQAGVDPSAWSGAPLSLPSNHTAAEAGKPASVTGLDSGTIERDIKVASGPSTGSVANLYELRLYGVEQGPSESTTWYSAVIKVDPGSHTWAVVGQGGRAVGAATASGDRGLLLAVLLVAVLLVAALSTLATRRRTRLRPVHSTFTP